MLRRAFPVALSFLLSGTPTIASADYWSDNGCVLDKPAPVFKNGNFKLNEKTGLATETVVLNENLSVLLQQAACEYQSRIYTFISTENPPEINVVGWQYRKAIELLSLLEERSDPSLKFTNEIQTLRSYEQLVADPKDDVDLNTARPQSEIGEFISLRSEIGEIRSETGMKIIIKMWSGPY
jgi:hypothetical protein